MSVAVLQNLLLASLVGFLLSFVGVQAQTTNGDMLMPLPTSEPDEDILDNGSGFGSGASGSGMDLMPETILCSNPTESLSVSLFDSISSAMGAFQCILLVTPMLDTNTSETIEPSLLFIVTLQGGNKLYIPQDDPDPPFIDFLDVGIHNVAVSACRGTGVSCDSMQIFEIGNVTININSYQRRLFPFGDVLNDDSFRNVLDGAVPIVIPETIPFWSRYYHTIYVSSNGLLSFNSPYLSWWPIPFPYGRSLVPIIAPYWTDLDFRNDNTESSKIYYQTYSSEDNGLLSLRSEVLLDMFNDRLRSYSDEAVDFEPDWMTVITWNKATPYYWRYYNDQSITFQLVLATDYINTYAFYLYQPGGFDVQLPSWRRVVIGYDAKDYRNFHNVELATTQYTTIDSVVGNTGGMGQWYFNFTAQSSEANSEQLCLEWARRQNDTFERYFSGLPSCPCTRRQARRDWRFWFAHFWGLSSRANCATFLWSRRQATLECCYDIDGSLLVGPNAGGSYLLYNPLFSFHNYFQQDRQPYQYCCSDSERCDLYYTHRPSDDCANYNPPRRFFIFGDPHFKSIDNNNFTFNGIGEYLLLQSPSNNLNIQARLEQFDPDTPGTILTSLVLKEGTTQSIQVNAESGSFVLYVNGVQIELPTMTSPIVVTSTGVSDISMSVVMSEDGALGTTTSSAQVFVRRDDTDGEDSLVITTPNGASLSVRMENSFLGISVELSESFRDDTSGLLGVFNGDVSDDFTLPNGTVLDISLEKDIYQFGLAWHVSEQDSLFSYSGLNYSALNGAYLDFEPTFFDELNITQEVMDACGTNQACILDASLTGNLEIGTSTLNVSMENDDLEMTLDNNPPSVSGASFSLYVYTMESISASFTVEDPDNDVISILKLTGHESSGMTFTIGITGSTGNLNLVWPSPGYNIPSKEIRIVTTDSNGASASRRISIILCGCMNGGNCASLIDDLPFNSNGHHKQLCTCPQFYGGESCEIEMRGCAFNVCPDYAKCVDDNDSDAGNTCSNCTKGYNIITDGDENKCIDVDECNTTMPLHNCTQLCVNTEGSYTCDCMSGYRLGSYGLTCEDVNECEEGSSGCSQICQNTDGSYDCSCHPGYSVSGSNTKECDLATCSQNPCDNGLSCGDNAIAGIGILECICPIGQRCTGVCSGLYTNLETSVQLCEDCTGSSYGFNCEETCHCLNGACDKEMGCVCPDGTWKGTNCSIEINDYSPVFDLSSLAPSSPVQWDLSANSIVASIRATDSDTNPNSGSVLYSIIKSQYNLPDGVSDGVDFFVIDPRNGDISSRMNLYNIYQMHGFSSFALTILAVDKGEIPRSAQTTVTIVPRPVPVITDGVQPIEVRENTAISSVVFNRFNCTEIGPSSNSLMLTLNDTSSGLFALDQDTSSLVVSRPLDYELLIRESRTMFSLHVICSNRYQISDSVRVQIEITNEDDNPFEFNMQLYSGFIFENTSRGVTVLSVRASDADLPGAIVKYFFVNDVSEFLLTPDTGNILLVSEHLNREETETYYLQVMAQVQGAGTNVLNTVMANVTITLIDVNDERPFFVPSNVYIVNELFSDSNVGDLVVVVEARDLDSGSNGQVTYQLEENDFFTINETSGSVFVKSTLEPNLHLRLTVYAIDGGATSLMSSAEINILVRPSPDRLQFDQQMYTFEVYENVSRGNAVGTVRASIIDENNATFNATNVHSVEYVINGGTNASIFTISTIDGEIFLLSSLDFEQARDYVFGVNATLTSDETISTTSVVRVRVLNINDHPPRFTSSYYTSVVEEFTPSGRNILSVFAMDLDSSDVTYRLDSSVDSSTFLLDQITGVLTARVELTDIQDYRFSVMASDGELETEAVIFISVTRSISIAPSFTREKYVFNISENAAPGTSVGTVVALTRGNLTSDEFPHLGFRLGMPDLIGSNSSIGANGTAQLFHIHPTSGDIFTQSIFEFDSESQVRFVLYVEVFNTDNGTVFDSVAVEVHISDVNDNEPIFSQSLYTRVIYTLQPVSSVILTVAASDLDSTTNSDIDYAIQSGPLGFMLDSNSGDLSVTNSTLIPGDYYLTVVSTDRGNPKLKSTAAIFIAVLPAVPEQVEFNETVYSFAIPENASPGALVGVVQAFDSNRNYTSTTDDLTYSTPNLTLCFSLDPNDGEIHVSCQLDREMSPRYELELVATIRDTDRVVMGYSRVIVDILDINDNGPVFSLDVYASVINDMYGNDIILEVSATDSDFGDNGTVQYSLLEAQGLMSNITSYFNIDSTTGEITLSSFIPVIPIGDYRLTAVASDLGIPERMSSTALVLICVTRSQPRQVDITTRDFTVEENAEPGTVVGRISLMSGVEVVVLSEYPNNLEFSIIDADIIFNDFNSNQMSGTPSSPLFLIDRIDGTIQTIEGLDREEATSHVLVVVANFTRFGIAEQVSITITVLDQNDVSPEFMPVVYSREIDDSRVNGEVIINITALDYDLGSNANISFSIEEIADFPFGVEFVDFVSPATYGQIVILNSSSLIPGNYRFTVIGTDGGSTPLNGTAEVFIIVVHSLPEEIFFPNIPYVFNLTENSPEGTFVGNVSVDQETPALDNLLYSITHGNDGGYFSVDSSSGTITSLRTINRELVSQFSLTIEAVLLEEPSLNTASTIVTVNINDVNDNRPIFLSGTFSTMILSNEVTTINSLLRADASDDDEGSNAQLQFNITSGNNEDLFNIDNLGRIFANSAPLNISTYQLTVTAEDMGEPPLTGTALVTIVIQDTIPSGILFTQPNGYVFVRTENSDFTSPIGQVSIEPIRQDLEQYIGFSRDSNLFSVDTDGYVRSNGNLDYEDANNHTINVTATLDIPIDRFTPKVTLTTTVQVVILVVDLNDNSPVFVDFPFFLSQLEERESEEMLAQVVAMDADSGTNQQLEYQLINSDEDVRSKFRIDSSSGLLFTSPELDREEQDVYYLLIQVCDMGTVPRCIMQTVNFTLLDINDNSPVLTSGTVYEVRERLPAGTPVFTITASDPDLGPFGVDGVRHIFFDLHDSSNTDLGDGVIFGEDGRTGIVTLLEELDYEMDSSYTAQIRLRDNFYAPNNGGFKRADFNIIINVIDEPDNQPQFVLESGETNYVVTTDPMVDNGETVTEVLATDADTNDVITYSIVSPITEDGNNGIVPLLRIEQESGRIISEGDQTFNPEANFMITVQAFDNSQFNLSVIVLVSLIVIPEQLQFEQRSYTINVSENVPLGSELVRLPIQRLSASLQITYVIDAISPNSQAGIFTHSGNGGPEAVITLANSRGFDRENVDRYTVTVRATRLDPAEETTTELVINIVDENDNNPQFIDGDDPVIMVMENIASQTVISQINVTDADINENGQVRLTFDPPLPTIPFSLNAETGELRVIGTIDYEEQQSFSLTILAMDSGSQPRSSVATYIVQVMNQNDRFPEFSALAYFGEVYAGATSNDLVNHVVLSVTDADDVNNEQQLTFEIRSSTIGENVGYMFQVVQGPPYYVQVIDLPEVEDVSSKLLSLSVVVSDGKLSSNVPLYISIYTTNNLISFDLGGVSKQQLESCAVAELSLCEFLDVLDIVFGEESSGSTTVSFYNHSVVISPDDTTHEQLTIRVYGWYNGLYDEARNNNGELQQNTNPLEVQYISYSSNTKLFSRVALSDQFLTLDFRVSLFEEMTVEPTSGPNLTVIVIGIVCGVVFAGLVIVLIIVLVCVFGRKRDSPRKRRRRRPSDPYLRNPRSRRPHRKSRRGSKEEIALSPTGGSDLAYETMYDDDEILDKNQTMPWFDPKYLATDETYDGDTEWPKNQGNRNQQSGPVRATVDGNARRQRRHSSDDSAAAAESVSDIDTAGYLQEYQQSTPLQPGQRMGEFDMFASPPDSDRPFRPSLEQYQWQQKQKPYK